MKLIWVEWDNGESYSDHSHNVVGIFSKMDGKLGAEVAAEEYLKSVKQGSCSFCLIERNTTIDEHNSIYLGEMTVSSRTYWDDKKDTYVDTKPVLNFVDSELVDLKTLEPKNETNRK